MRAILRAFIVTVRSGAMAIYYIRRAARRMMMPVVSVGRMLMRTIGVPLYRGSFFFRRLKNRLYLPGKNKVLYVLTNRYAIHGFVIIVAMTTTVASVQARGLRPEEFGQRSALYELVSGQDNELIIVRSDSIAARPTKYLGFAVGDVTSNIDFHSPDDEYVTLNTSAGAAIVAPTIADAKESTAPRNETVEYIVQSGDTPSGIAAAYDISLATLLSTNNLTISAAQRIKPGDTLRILATDGLEHTVRSGDTVLALAKKYDADAEEIVSYNKLASSSDLSVGQVLIIPGGVAPSAAPVTPPRVTTPIAEVIIPDPERPIASSGKMIWPTDLRVITQYWNWRHTGVDIDCHFTNNNYASDDGIVQFVGWKGGYGLTVEVNHGNGLVTRYAHHASLAVEAGQSVSKGQAVGVCGTTGRSTGTHLHFEVIKNGRFQNPLEYIR